MHDNDDPYLKFLAARVGKVFYRMPYPGNAGDSLIQFATKMILQDLQIDTTVDPRKAEVILVPGGNPTMWPSIGPQRWQILWERHKNAEFIVGPAGFKKGYSDWGRLINDAGKTVTGLFARDAESFKNLSTANLRPGITAALSHDPALYLRDSQWMAAHRQAATEEYDLVALRDDHETTLSHPALLRSLRSILPTRVHDRIVRRSAIRVRNRKQRLAKKLSDGFPLSVNDVSRQRFEVFVETIRAARAVHTDRLHVMLLACMLAKKIFAYPTIHGKLEDIYQHSLKGWADVTLVTL